MKVYINEKNSTCCESSAEVSANYRIVANLSLIQIYMSRDAFYSAAGSMADRAEFFGAFEDAHMLHKRANGLTVTLCTPLRFLSIRPCAAPFVRSEELPNQYDDILKRPCSLEL